MFLFFNRDLFLFDVRFLSVCAAAFSCFKLIFNYRSIFCCIGSYIRFSVMLMSSFLLADPLCDAVPLPTQVNASMYACMRYVFRNCRCILIMNHVNKWIFIKMAANSIGAATKATHAHIHRCILWISSRISKWNGMHMYASIDTDAGHSVGFLKRV